MGTGDRQERVRTAEVGAALCLGTDLGMGLPFEHGLHGTLVAMRLCERLGVDRATAAQAYHAALLMYSGCTADGAGSAATFGGSLTEHVGPVMFGSERQTLLGVIRALPQPDSPAPARALQAARRLPRAARWRGPHMEAICEVAEMLAERIGLPEVGRLFVHLTDRWDGRGPLRRARGEEVPEPIRIVHVARDAVHQRLLGGEDHAARVVRERAGHAFDPRIAARLADDAREILDLDRGRSCWDEVLDAEPEPHAVLEGEAIDRALSAIGDFADLASPHLAGHSAGVAALADAAATRLGMDEEGRAAVRRAALVHDVGRAAVHPRIWSKPGGLSVAEWEEVRLHPYQTERVLSRSPFLAALAPVAGAHHERMDGSGYHRGSGPELPAPARLLAAADAHHALTEPRPHRPALPPERASEEIARQVEAGRLDADAAGAVLAAVGGRPPPPLARPAGLTDREAEVVGMLARGLQTKQVAGALGISAKTADRHIQNAYRKIGVSSRAAATLFAMEHGLTAWGEIPIARAAARG